MSSEIRLHGPFSVRAVDTVKTSWRRSTRSHASTSQGSVNRLTRLPQAANFALREEGYVDKCHLCQEIRTHLRPHFPDILCPDSYYPPIASSPAPS